MKQAILIIIASIVMVITGGCAKTWQAAPFPNQSVKIENSEMARIYLICDTFAGSTKHDVVTDNDDYIGMIGPTSFLCWERESGKANIAVGPDSKLLSKASIDLKATRGNTYYIQLHRYPGPTDGALLLTASIYKLESIDEEKGKMLLKKCKPAKNIK